MYRDEEYVLEQHYVSRLNEEEVSPHTHRFESCSL